MVQGTHDGVQDRVPPVAKSGESVSCDVTFALRVTEGKYLQQRREGGGRERERGRRDKEGQREGGREGGSEGVSEGGREGERIVA